MWFHARMARWLSSESTTVKTARLESTTTEKFFITFLTHLPELFNKINIKWPAVPLAHTFSYLLSGPERTEKTRSCIVFYDLLNSDIDRLTGNLRNTLTLSLGQLSQLATLPWF